MTREKRLEPGVLLHIGDDDRQRHANSQLPVICYGPTGNGFFANAGTQPEKFATAENRKRAERAIELATQMAATPNQIALAWLRAQPFPVIPILGTANPEHLQDALGVEKITITPEQAYWLETGETSR